MSEGARIVYLPVNMAWAVMAGPFVLRIFNTKAEAQAEADDLNREPRSE